MLKNIKIGKKRWALFCLLYVGFILFLSTRQTSKALGHSYFMEIARNLMHVPLYGILGVLLIRALSSFVALLPAFVMTLFIGVSISCADEYVQSFTPGRTVSLGDIGLDLIGICLAIVLVHKMRKIMIGGCGNVAGGRNS